MRTRSSLPRATVGAPARVARSGAPAAGRAARVFVVAFVLVVFRVLAMSSVISRSRAGRVRITSRV